jgi:hypothetical protein
MHIILDQVLAAFTELGVITRTLEASGVLGRMQLRASPLQLAN